ncbi:MAG TPA: hypothetical protein VL401_03020 [Alphaproteobacteria bacterium]|jgi:hypothetical protein|nr:hypothetical protein [Alphaproteobacteria bacterium]
MKFLAVLLVIFGIVNWFFYVDISLYIYIHILITLVFLYIALAAWVVSNLDTDSDWVALIFMIFTLPFVFLKGFSDIAGLVARNRKYKRESEENAEKMKPKYHCRS